MGEIDALAERGADGRYGWNGNWTRFETVAGLPTQNTVGWDVRQDRIDPIALYSTAARERLSTTRSDRARETSYAIYFENQTQWNEWLRTIAGLRGDMYRFDVDRSPGKLRSAQRRHRLAEVVRHLGSLAEPSRPSKRYGIEWSNRYAPTKWLLVDLDLAWTRARFSEDDPVGNYIPGALNTAAALGFTVHNLGPWTVAFFGRYFGPRPLIEDNSVRSKSTTVFNAQATYDINKRLKVRFDVFNLFDSKFDDITYYYTSRLQGEPADGVNDIHFHPVESRSFRLGALYSF